MPEKIYLSSPHMGGKEMDFIKEAFDTNWIAPLGPNVNNFEKELCTYTGASHAAVLTSGTAAIHLGLILAGVKQGDEVICQSFTFAASANPIIYCGAKPVFVDSEPDTWNMCPEALKEAILDRKKQTGKYPAAVIPVHLYGMPAKIDEICTICDSYRIPVIEDAAEALGSHINGIKCGTYGNFAVLSFNGNKIITTSGGGALIGESEKDIAKARFLATQARDNAPHYEHSHIGYNYRMSNIAAGIGRGQLLVLDSHIQKRRSNFEFYKTAFSDIESISFLDEPAGYFSNHWLTTIIVDEEKTGISRDDIRLRLEEHNIESRPLWKPMHMQPVFKDCPYYGSNVCEDLFKCGLCLPSGSNLKEQDLVRIAGIVREFFV